MSHPLDQYGWNDTFAAAFAAHAGEGRVPGRVVLEHTHIFRVGTADGELLARVSGRLRHRAESRPDFPAVGDWVVVEPVADSDARIHAVLPRFSRFSRRAAGDTTEAGYAKAMREAFGPAAAEVLREYPASRTPGGRSTRFE